MPIWVGSLGSAAGLRRVARLGDGWLASAYNTTPGAPRRRTHESGRGPAVGGPRPGRLPARPGHDVDLVTDNRAEADAKLGALASMLDRDPAVLAQQVLIGSADHCAAI